MVASGSVTEALRTRADAPRPRALLPAAARLPPTSRSAATQASRLNVPSRLARGRIPRGPPRSHILEARSPSDRAALPCHRATRP